MVTFTYELIYVFTAATGLLGLLAELLGLGKAGFLLFIIQLAVTSLFVIFKNNGLTGKLISVGVLSSFTILLVILSRNEAFMGKAVENIRILWILAFALGGFILGELLAYLRIARIIIALGSFISLIPFLFLNVNVSKLYVVAAFSLMIFMLASEFQRKWKKSGDTDLKKHIVFVSPFIVLVLLLLLISPAPAEKYQWKVVKNVYKITKQAITDIRMRLSIRYNEDYAISLMGFSDEAEMSGKVKENSEIVMTIYDIPEESISVYLSGKNFSDFTGREWLDNDTEEAPDQIFDSISLLASVKEYTDYDTDQEGNFVKWESILIKYIQMNTDYVFCPPKTNIRGSKFNIYKDDITYKGSDVLWPETQNYKTTYIITYLLPNTDNENFVDLLLNSDTPSEEAYDKAMRKFGVYDMPEYSYKEFLKHKAYIHDEYCQDVEISDELKDYLDELLEGCENDYEKVLRIQELLKTFEYTTAPGKLPEEIDSEKEFLDYFILQTRKGYCSYYATALVLLSRYEGIPARYVQGYHAKTNGRKNMYIRSSMAHAWAEIYFDGVGWIVVDATPGYEGGNLWEGNANDFHYPEFGNYESDEKEEKTEPLPELPPLEEENEIYFKWYMVVIPVVSGLFVIAVFFAVFKVISAISFKKKNAEVKFIIISRQIFVILKLLGKPIEESETISEYKERLIKKDFFEDRLAIFDDLENYLYNYSEKMDLTDACTNAEKIRRELLSELKSKSILKYIRFHLKFI